jgi:hypothetical protein
MSPTRIPGIPYASAPRSESAAYALSWPPRLVVIHDTGNTASAAAEANYAATRNDPRANWTSCHAYIDGGGPLGSLSLGKQAWAAFGYANANGIHLEMCGMNAGAPGAVPAGTIARTAALTAVLCDLAGIPKTHLSPAQVAAGARGICGHYDITRGLGVGDHDDPGPSFDWSAFIAAVNRGGNVDEIERKADNGDRWGAAAITGAQPATYLGSDGVQRTTGNSLHTKLDAIRTAVTTPVSVSMSQADRDAIVAALAGLVPTLQQIEDAAFRGAQRAEDS